MKTVLQRAIQGGASGGALELLRSVQAMPQHAFGDPQAAASLGNQVSRSASAVLEAEAKTAAENFANEQLTLRYLAEKASTEEERGRLREAVERSGERSMQSHNRRIDAIEHATDGGNDLAKTLALGAAGLVLLGAVYVATKDKK